jgi:hypothetical protein
MLMELIGAEGQSAENKQSSQDAQQGRVAKLDAAMAHLT